MKIRLYHTRNTFEILPCLTLAQIQAESSTVLILIIGWCTINMELSFRINNK